MPSTTQPTLNRRSLPVPSLFLSLLFLSWTAAAQAAPATRFNYAIPTPSAGVTYGVGSSVTFFIGAVDGAGNTDAAFSGPVTFGLFDSSTTLLSDPTATFNTATQSVTGTGPLTFTSGNIAVTVTFTSGTDSEQLWLQHPTIVNGKTYPGNFGTLNPSFKVQGFSTNYYAKDLNNDNSPAVYPGSNDELRNPAVTNPIDRVVVVPESASVTGSSAYAVTNIYAGYAYGGALVLPNIWIKKTNNSSSPTFNFEVILDYGGVNPLLADWNTPRTAFDTVFTGSTSGEASSSFGVLNTATQNMSFQNFKPFLQGGQVILRVWATGSAGNPVSMRYAASSPVNMSLISVPYSSQNTLPVKGTLSPAVVPDSAVTSLTYVVKNQYSSPISYLAIEIPNSPTPTAQYWNVSGVSSSWGGASVSVASNPSVSAPGTIMFHAATGSPVTVNGSVTITLNVTVTDKTFNPWAFTLLAARTDTDVSAPTDSSAAVIQTLGIPNIPSGFTAVPANFTAGGGSVSLSWNQVLNEGAQGYIIDRAPGDPSFPATLSPNSVTSYVDNTASNLTGYTYQIKSYNAIAQSGNAPVGPVTAFANPAAPTGLTTLSGGTTVRLDWSASVSAPGSYPIGGYQILRGGQGAEVLLTTTGASAVSFIDSPLGGGVSYFYRVAAVDNKPVTGAPGTGAHVSALAAEEPYGYPPGNPPLNPAAVLLSSAPATIRFDWTAPVSNLTAPVSYLINRATNAGPSTPLTQVAAAGLSILDTGVVNGNFYVYQVAARDAAGVTTNYSAGVTGRVGPSAPTGFTASASNTGVTLTWNANPGPEGVVRYVLLRNAVQIANPTGTAVTDTTAAQGTDYTYQVMAVDNVPVTGPSSALSSALLPNAPASFSAAVNPVVLSNVDLNWLAPVSGGNVTGYNIYRDTDNNIAGASPITMGVTGLTYQDTSLGPVTAAGMDFYYFLQAQNIGGAGAVTLRTLRIPPNPPTGIGTSSTAATITVFWTARPPSENVTNYRVYRVDPVGPTTVVTTIPAAPVTYNDGTAATGKSYTYFVTAMNSGGEGFASGNAVIGRLPQTPTGLTITSINTGNDITVSWSAVTLVDPNATSVSLLINTVNNSGSAVTVNLAASAVSYVDTVNSASTTYFYWLQTNNAYGTGALTAPVSQLTYPGAPVFSPITLAPDNVSMPLNWTTSPSDTQYQIYRKLSTGVSFIPVSLVSASGLTFPVTLQLPVQNGKIYDLKVAAINPTGQGPDSNIQSVLIGPSVVTGVTATSGLSSAVPNVGITWNLSPLSEGVTTYRVQRSTVVSSGYAQIGTTASPVTNFLDTTAADGVVHYYILSSFANGIESEVSTTNAVAVTAYRLPNAPGGLAAAPGNGSVSFGWSSAGVATTYPVSIYNVTRVAAGVTAAFSTASTSYTDNTVVNGTVYDYYVRARDDQNHLSVLSGPVTVQPLAPPAAPTNLSVAVGDQQLQVTWQGAIPGTLAIGSYEVYRSTGGPYSLLATVGPSATGYLDQAPPLTNGASYFYYLRTLDNSGAVTGLHASANSVTVTASPLSGFVNPASNAAATAGVSQIILSWTDSVTISGAATVVSYNVFRSVNNQFSGYVSLANYGPGSSPVTYTGLSNGSAYYFYVVANSASTVSAHSATVFGIPASPPAAPASIFHLDGNDQVALSWTPSPNQGVVTIVDYTILQAIPPGAAAVPLTTTTGPVTFHTDNTPTNGNDVEYFIRARNSNNTLGPPSAPVTGHPYGPFAPITPSTAASSSAITVNWNPFGSPSYPVTGYSVYRRTSTGLYNFLAAPLTVLAGTTFADASVTLAQVYDYVIRAMDNQGHTSGSSPEVTDAAVSQLGAPATVLALAGDTQILIDWAPPPAAAGTLPVSFYILTNVNTSATTILPASQTYFLDTTAVNGAPVTYTVQAVDSTGNAVVPHLGVVSAAVSATGSSSVINPPTALQAAAVSSSAISLTWTPSNDMGRIILRYNVYRSTAFNGPFTTPIAALANSPFAPTTVFVDTGLVSNTTYYYVVRAVESGSLAQSSNSNHAFTTTLAPSGAIPPVTAGQMAFNANLIQPLKGETLGIYYMVPSTGPVEIVVYNVYGNPIRSIIPPGDATANAAESVTWDGRDRNGYTVASGLYLIEIRAGSFHQVKKVLVVK